MSTLADQVGACTTALQPLHALIERHVLAAERLHGDDTTVPILAKGKTVTGRIWTYVRDDRPLAVTHRRRRSITPRAIESTSIPLQHLQAFTGILQAPTPIAGTTSSTIPRALRERLRPHYDIPQGRLAEPWNWKQPNLQAAAWIGLICSRRGPRRGLTELLPGLEKGSSLVQGEGAVQREAVSILAHVLRVMPKQRAHWSTHGNRTNPASRTGEETYK